MMISRERLARLRRDRAQKIRPPEPPVTVGYFRAYQAHAKGFGRFIFGVRMRSKTAVHEFRIEVDEFDVMQHTHPTTAIARMLRKARAILRRRVTEDNGIAKEVFAGIPMRCGFVTHQPSSFDVLFNDIFAPFPRSYPKGTANNP